MRIPSSFIHAAVLVAISLPYVINLGISSIWDANEAFYAETPREMLVSGDYLAPHFNFQPRTQKPPLTYWAILVSYRLFGVNEFAVRVPGAIAAIGVLLFSYGIARMLHGPQAALMAALITATTARVFILARRLPIDILLLFFLTGTLFFLVRAIIKKDALNWAPVYLCAGLGFLVKGPVALVIPGGACLIWALWSRKLKWSEARILAGATIFVAVTIPWYVLIFFKHGWTYIAPFFLQDNLGRFAAESMGPSRGPFYYFSVAAIDFFPWSILLLCAIWVLWRYRKAEQPFKSLAFGLPLIWCLLIFVFFSLSKNKQEYYIAPLYPAAAVIISGILGRTLRKKSCGNADIPARDSQISDTGIVVETGPNSRDFWWKCAFGVLAILLCVLSLLPPYILRSFMPRDSRVLHYAPSAVLIAGAAILLGSIVGRRLDWGFKTLAVALWTIYIASALIYLPALEQYRPVKRFCRIIESQLGAEDKAGAFRMALPSMVYYLRRPVFEENSRPHLVKKFRSGKRIFCILTEKDYNYFVGKTSVAVYALDVHSRFALRLRNLMNPARFPGDELFLVSNRPDF